MRQQQNSSSFKLIGFAVLLMVLHCLPAFSVLAQNKGDAAQLAPTPEQKAEHILQRAIEAMGGSNYLNVRSVIGRGQFTQYKDGISGLPTAFIDYLVFPDKERTEFRGQGVRIIQVNVADKGWIYDGAAKTLKDMTPAQVEDFRLAMRTSVENFLRGVWRKEGAKLTYVGRREAGLARRNEALRLTYPDGFEVEFEFSTRDGLPAKVIYQRKNADGEEATEEDRLLQQLTINGIIAPFVIDHYRAGVQTSRINYESIEFNRPIPDSLFARPANVKAIK